MQVSSHHNYKVSNETDAIACVVIPAYKEHLSDAEKLSLRRNTAVLNNHPLYLIVPEHLKTSIYESVATCPIKIIRLHKKWFKSIKSYNQLMLSVGFYEMFSKYRYLLIAQLDTYVFRDELLGWCEKGYSYIGAPWPHGPLIRPYSFKGSYWLGKLMDRFLNRPHRCYVGNGGFSLRSVKDTIRLLNKRRLQAKLWHINEDFFFARVGGSVNWFRIPDLVESIQFAFESTPSQLYQQNNNQLPFGCHAWEKWGGSFYDSIIK